LLKNQAALDISPWRIGADGCFHGASKNRFSRRICIFRCRYGSHEAMKELLQVAIDLKNEEATATNNIIIVLVSAVLHHKL
jgi:hypothetical protein